MAKTKLVPFTGDEIAAYAMKQVEPDVVGLINAMQQQLVSLEKKIDSLISQSSERPFKERHFERAARSFNRHYHHGKERNFTKFLY